MLWPCAVQPSEVPDFGIRYGIQIGQAFGYDFGYGEAASPFSCRVFLSCYATHAT
jgi:hypothetical protein